MSHGASALCGDGRVQLVRRLLFLHSQRTLVGDLEGVDACERLRELELEPLVLPLPHMFLVLQLARELLCDLFVVGLAVDHGVLPHAHRPRAKLQRSLGLGRVGERRRHAYEQRGTAVATERLLQQPRQCGVAKGDVPRSRAGAGSEGRGGARLRRLAECLDHVPELEERQVDLLRLGQRGA